MAKELSLNLYNKDKRVLFLKNIPYIVKDNILNFEYDNVNYKVKYSNSEVTFQRESKEFLFTIDFINKLCTYLLKEQDLNLDIKVINCSYKLDNNILEMKYLIESEENEIKIEILFDKGEFLWS